VIKTRSLLRLTVGASVLTFACPSYAQDAASEDRTEEIVVTAQEANQTGLTHGGRVGVLGDKSAEDVPFTIKS
jgi:iron complex outermembrane receptor protein